MSRKSNQVQLLGGVPEGLDAQILAETSDKEGVCIFVARDDIGLARITNALEFFSPETEVLSFPAWDCLPYDRVSPKKEIINLRIDALIKLSATTKANKKILITTISALMQKIPPKSFFTKSILDISLGKQIDQKRIITFLREHGFISVETVMEPGEFAYRGGIIDVFTTGSQFPRRLDFFGDQLETIRAFDPINQRTIKNAEITDPDLKLYPISEISLDSDSISLFRTNYRQQFGENGLDDPLYESISSGNPHIGMEHWLPLFWQKLETLFDYLPEAKIFFDYQAEETRNLRIDLIKEYYLARLSFTDQLGSTPYRPIKPEQLFIEEELWKEKLSRFHVSNFFPFLVPNSETSSFDFGGRIGKTFSEIRTKKNNSIFTLVSQYIKDKTSQGFRVVIATYSEGTRSRLEKIFHQHGLHKLIKPDSYKALEQDTGNDPALVVLQLERGFSTKKHYFITEQDILGERLKRHGKRRIRPENFITDISTLNLGDFVVHIDHGIGKFAGLESIKIDHALHDCVKILYADNNKLFLPVENIEVLSRYGAEQAEIKLDRLGTAAWQLRKATIKKRIKEIAQELIKTAAAREIGSGIKINLQEGPYDEFCARFAFEETEDQAQAISETLHDLKSGKSTDRLICGDVGFGKTEIAMRAAFVSAMDGMQVAIVVPTTLLARQHFHTFKQRFFGFPTKIEQLSRFVPPEKAKRVKKSIQEGNIDIVIGTHALLSKDIDFKNLGLLIIDEEQHFGVTHKERLKQLKTNVHVITLTATPIPRTLQLALTGLREMSLISTPPVDRLAVRTFILPYDPVIIREAILRERSRGGQTYYVCPRVADIIKLEDQLHKLVPDIKIGVAHGKLAASELNTTISEFYNGNFDLLLSTNIVESGLDLPKVNTIIIHRADMFGLSQLYQLRGRVGRSKVRAFAYLTLPPKQKITETAEKRLGVMQTLDTLGSGFSLASHDLDIRGAGNLLGDQQTGHVREVGIELYQQMLQEAVSESRNLNENVTPASDWSPQIFIGVSVLIPETFVPEINLRMSLYRRLASLGNEREIESFAAELCDRFGQIPQEVENLLRTISLKNLCKAAGIEKLEGGTRGVVITFRNASFANPVGLVNLIAKKNGSMRLRNDHKLVFTDDWACIKTRFDGVESLVSEIIQILHEPQ